MKHIHIKTLSDRKIQMVRNALAEGISVNELAQALGVSTTTIKSLRIKEDDASHATNTRQA